MKTKKKNDKSMNQEVREEFLETVEDIMKECQYFKRWLCLEESAAEFTISTIELDMRNEIRNYARTLQAPEYKSTLNNTIQLQLPSAKSLTEYYESHPELTEYTMKKELSRMDYTVHTKDGKRITKPSQIQAYQKEINGKNDLLWRCSNQSILGDVVAALTSSNGLIRPQMEAGTCVDYISLVVDFRNKEPFVRVECFMNVSIPCNTEIRLALAGVLVMVYFCPGQQKFLGQVTRVFPCPSLTENQVNAAAESLSYYSYQPTKIKTGSPKFQPFSACMMEQGDEWKERLQWYNSRLQWHRSKG